MIVVVVVVGVTRNERENIEHNFYNNENVNENELPKSAIGLDSCDSNLIFFTEVRSTIRIGGNVRGKGKF